MQAVWSWILREDSEDSSKKNSEIIQESSESSSSPLCARDVETREGDYAPEADDHNFSFGRIGRARLRLIHRKTQSSIIPWARVHPRSFGRIQVGFKNRRTLMPGEVYPLPKSRRFCRNGPNKQKRPKKAKNRCYRNGPPQYCSGSSSVLSLPSS